MSLLSAVADLTREFVGVADVADLGLVYLGNIGYAECRIEASITQRAGTFYVRLVVENKRSAGTKTSVINWPFSTHDPRDLQQFCSDLQVIENANLVQASLPDNRDAFMCGIDYMFGIRHLGEHAFEATVPDEVLNGLKLKAMLSGWGNGVDVTLSESRQPGVVILAQFPHAACEKIRRALVEYTLSPGE